MFYLDSAATSHQPTAVLEAQEEFYRLHYGAVGRGAHLLAEEATEAFEAARSSVEKFVGAGEGEIVWTGNATAAINLVASGIGAASQGIGGDDAQTIHPRGGRPDRRHGERTPRQPHPVADPRAPDRGDAPMDSRRRPTGALSSTTSTRS